MTNLEILQGDALERLKELPNDSVHCCVTSPPYYGLRDYGVIGQIGLEKTPEEYVAKLVEVFQEVRRVLRKDGTLWLNLGDSYSASPVGRFNGGSKILHGRDLTAHQNGSKIDKSKIPGLKPKDLIGIPWMVAFALRADGWWLRSDIIWSKPNCMPESVTDRPTRSHEYIFLLSKSARYYYNAEAIKERCSESFMNDSRWDTGSTDKNQKSGYDLALAQNPKRVHRIFDKPKLTGGAYSPPEQSAHSNARDKQQNGKRTYEGFNGRWDEKEANGDTPMMRNKRDVWTVSPAMFADAHFATFPVDLIKPCILAGCPIGGTVLDPFAGSGTTGQVALELGRKAVLIELNPEYIKLIEQRTNVTMGLPL